MQYMIYTNKYIIIVCCATLQCKRSLL